MEVGGHTMAEIKDCIGKKVKISKTSITIKSDDGKTCGVVRDIITLYDLQANKQIDYLRKIRNLSLSMKDISIRNIIIKDKEMYVFRNINSKLFHEKYGYFSEEEKKKSEEQEKIYSMLEAAGINVIECIFV